MYSRPTLVPTLARVHLGWLGSPDIYVLGATPLLGWCSIRRPACLCLLFLQGPHEVKEILDSLERGLDMDDDARPTYLDRLFKRSGTLDDLPILDADGGGVVKQLSGTDGQISFR